jgi:hypothetical protein
MAHDALPRLKRDLPRFPHKLTHETLAAVTKYYTEHVRRDTAEARLAPSDMWRLVDGFVLAASQTYGAVCSLLADKRPKPLLLQAAVLNRSLYEILVTVCALFDNPAENTAALLTDSYRTIALKLADQTARFGTDPSWQTHLEVMRQHVARRAADIRLPEELAKSPKKIPEWPTPGRLVFGSRHAAPLVSGSRAAVLKELYRTHYGSQSAQAHGRVVTMAMAWFVEHPEEHVNPGHAESNQITFAQICLACLLSEITATARYDVHPRLLELWTYLREIDGEAKELWSVRYEQVLAPASTTV